MAASLPLLQLMVFICGESPDRVLTSSQERETPAIIPPPPPLPKTLPYTHTLPKGLHEE